MKRSLLIIFTTLFLLYNSALSFAANSVVQTKVASTAGDSTITFSVAPGASNRVFVIAESSNITDTISITGWAGSVGATLISNVHHGTAVLTVSAWCLVPDGADTSFVVDSTANAATRVVAQEVSGSNGCTSDGTQTAEGTGMAQTMIGMASSATGTYFLCYNQSNSVADFTTTGVGFSSIGNADALGDNTEIGSVGQGAYLIAGVAATYTSSWTSAANETTLMACISATAAISSGLPIGTYPMSGIGR